MGSIKEGDEKLRKVLAGVYRNRTGPDPDELWEMKVMNAVRRLPGETSPGWTEDLGRMFWRFCPVAAAALVLLAVAAFRYDAGPAFDLAQIITDDTVETILMDPNR